jgi:DNA polymerase-1
MMETKLIFDGHNAIWRIFHAVPELTVKGKPVQIVFGILKLLHAALEKFQPEMALVCWDSGRPVLRREIYDKYKLTREDRRKTDPVRQKNFFDVNKQLGMVKLVISHMAVCQVEIPNVEGDDLIAMSCNALEDHKTVVSSDRDMLQLVGPDISIWSPIKAQLYTEKNFKTFMDGLSPRQYLETRILVGDKTDGIPGIAKGLGESTAVEVIKRYGSLKKIYSSSSIRKKLEGKGNRYRLLFIDEFKSLVERNTQLMDLGLVSSDTAAEIIRSKIRKKKKVDREFLKRYFLRNRFLSLMQDFGDWLQPFLDLEDSDE